MVSLNCRLIKNIKKSPLTCFLILLTVEIYKFSGFPLILFCTLRAKPFLTDTVHIYWLVQRLVAALCIYCWGGCRRSQVWIASKVTSVRGAGLG